MDDLISRQAAIDAMTECYWSIMGDEPPKLDEKTALYVDLKQAVKRLPTAEKRGKWMRIQYGEDDFDYDYKCSNCSYAVWDDSDYCPNCGARMDGGDENDDR